jgi:hypothetical protein
MVNLPPKLADGMAFRQRLPKLSSFRRQLRLLKWLIPAGLILLVIAYEVGPSLWIYEGFGSRVHLVAEILLFGAVGPIVVFILLELLGRWIDEKETADFQAELLAQANEKELEVRQTSDDTLQVLFATSLLIGTLKSDQSNLPSNTAKQIEITEQALNETMQRLYTQLMDE